MPGQNQLPRRTLEELVVIHSVEPDIHDVIVEGASDQNIVEWFLLENGRTKSAVYEVGLFEIDPDAVKSLGLQDNNKGRVITIADAVAKLCGKNPRITCVADRDLDKVLETEHNFPSLLITDYACSCTHSMEACWANTSDSD